MPTHSILAWRIPMAEEPGGLRSTGSQRVGHDRATKHSSFLYGPTLTSIHDYWKNHNFDQMDLCWQSDVSAFNMLSRFVKTFPPSSKCLLISQLQPLSAEQPSLKCWVAQCPSRILLSSLYILPSKHHINSNYYLHADDSQLLVPISPLSIWLYNIQLFYQPSPCSISH